MASWVPPILSSVLAGVVAIVSTVAIEKLGGAVGGVIASSPTSSVLASIGIAIQSPDRLDEAMHSIPTVMLINTLFLHIWRVLPPHLPVGWKFNRKLATMICTTLGIWFAVAATFVVIVRYAFNNNILAIQIFGALSMATQLVLGLTAVLKQKRAVAKAKNNVGVGTLLSRGVLASVAVILAILLSKINGTVAALATSFPAVFTTTMISLWISQGENVTSGAVGPMILGAFSGPVFAIAMSLLAPLWGPFIGALVSYIIAITTCSIPVGFILNRLESRYKPLGPDDDNKVVDDTATTVDESELDTQPAQIDLDHDTQSPQIELTDDSKIDSNDTSEDSSSTAPSPAQN